MSTPCAIAAGVKRTRDPVAPLGSLVGVTFSEYGPGASPAFVWKVPANV